MILPHAQRRPTRNRPIGAFLALAHSPFAILTEHEKTRLDDWRHRCGSCSCAPPRGNVKSDYLGLAVEIVAHRFGPIKALYRFADPIDPTPRGMPERHPRWYPDPVS